MANTENIICLNLLESARNLFESVRFFRRFDRICLNLLESARNLLEYARIFTRIRTRIRSKWVYLKIYIYLSLLPLVHISIRRLYVQGISSLKINPWLQEQLSLQQPSLQEPDFVNRAHPDNLS